MTIAIAKNTHQDAISRGRSATRDPVSTRRSKEENCADSTSTFSDSIPRSHSPTARTSRYVRQMHRDRLRVLLHRHSQPEPRQATTTDEYPGVRCHVSSLPYIDPKSRYHSGHYTGAMDVVSKLPDGEGALYCRDGRVFDGVWRLGELLPMDALRTLRSSSTGPCSDVVSICSDVVSICSSLTTSATRRRCPEVADVDEKMKVPKNVYVVTRSLSRC